MNKIDTIIVGGGLSGLTVAHQLRKAGHKIALFEKSHRIGGALQSLQKDGYFLELGPNTVMASAEILELAETLQIQDQLVWAPKGAARFIQYKNKLHRMPPGPLSIAGFVRALCEFLVPRGSMQDEDVWHFFQRRFGAQVADRLVSPFVSGIWAGDAKTLSLNSAFPSLATWESEHKSVLKGLIKSRKKKKSNHKKGLISFKNGMGSFADALSKSIGDNLHIDTNIENLTRKSHEVSYPWEITTSAGVFNAKNVVLTLPTHESALLLKHMAPAGANALKNIPYAPLKVLHLGFRRADVKHSLEGFGYLVPPVEGKNILGCLWSSSLFADRAPKGCVLLTVFMGGMTNKTLAAKSDHEAIALACKDIAPILKIQDAPIFSHVTTYTQSIPQYTLGHGKRRQALHDLENEFPGLFFVGNYLEGVSVGDVLKHALKRADQLQKSDRD